MCPCLENECKPAKNTKDSSLDHTVGHLCELPFDATNIFKVVRQIIKKRALFELTSDTPVTNGRCLLVHQRPSGHFALIQAL